MTCECGYADECDGEHGTLYPLQDGGMCSVVSCKAPKRVDPRSLLPAEELMREMADLLAAVLGNFTRDDDLPDNLLPRIHAGLYRT